jgi:trehalose 6-phosphate phosphatase
MAVLERHPSGLFSDFDGTLSHIAPTPDSARPFPGTSEAIARLRPLVDEFAIVTGRAAADALDRIGVPEIRVIGNHGLEMIFLGEHTANPIGVASRESIERALSEISSEVSAVVDATGMYFENKVYSASIHYRNSPTPDLVESFLNCGSPAANSSLSFDPRQSSARERHWPT